MEPQLYYEITAPTVHSAIAKRLEYKLLHALVENVRQRLTNGLRVEDPDHCARLLAEAPQRERLRFNLTVEKGKLEQAIAELNGLPGTS